MKKVSVIVPCRNEEKYIDKCLQSIVSQTYPKELMDIHVIDGESSDDTRNIVARYSAVHGNIHLHENPDRTTPYAMNIGIRRSIGDYVIRMDAHAEYPFDYVENSVSALESCECDNAGGTRKIALKGDGVLPLAACSRFGLQKQDHPPELIIICGSHCEYPQHYVEKCVEYSNMADNVGGAIEAGNVNHLDIARQDRFGNGGSKFRTGAKEPIEVDTVFGGCYRREVFERIGMFNEKLTRGQDLEFNLRLKKAGMKTMLFPDISCVYYARTEFIPFIRHAFQDGRWITLGRRYAKGATTNRHLVPMLFILTLPLSIWPYMALNLFRSIQIALKYKRFKYLILMPFSFLSFHIAYGMGSVWGCVETKK